MSLTYRAISWNPQKKLYDVTLVGLLLLGLAAFAGVSLIFKPGITPETLIIRWSAVSALVLLHFILAIGPLARLNPHFLPLLYNRRHLGVTLFALAFLHAAFATLQFHAGGDQFALVSIFTAYSRDYTSGEWAHFPFEIFGFGALCIFFLMAATSHDFWLKTLGPSVWKMLHLGVYVAYGLVLIHVLLGALQSERHPALAILLGVGFLFLTALHVAARVREIQKNRVNREAEADGFQRVLSAGELHEGVGRVVQVGGEKIALFAQDGRVFALSNVCRHQGGPIGEGRILAGCVTCPWHGYQYLAKDGCSPPPFHEILPTYRVRILENAIYVHPQAFPPGTESPGEPLPDVKPALSDEFYVGWQRSAPMSVSGFLRRMVIGLALFVPILFGTIAWMQNPIDPGTFEFGVVKDFEGILHDQPVPMLISADRSQPYLLVGAGKFGPPPDLLSEFDGQRVRLKGSLIHRDGTAMIEINASSTPAVLSEERIAPPSSVMIGAGTFVGELVDTKCFLGVMRPATGKVHRACAVRCLSGGIAPGLLVRGADESGVVYFLVGPDGDPLDYDVQLAARTLKIEGTLEILNGVPILKSHSLSTVE